MIEPYYEQDGITIYNADCREVLPQLAPVNLVLTDPPFFMPATHYQSRVKWQRSWGDTSILKTFWSVVCDAIVPKIRPTGHFLAFCNHESYPVFYPEMYGRFDFLKSLVWDKENVGLGRVWRNQHELVIAARWETSEFQEDGKLRSDVMRYRATLSAQREHPVEKPTSLLVSLIQPTTPKSGIVLDPFAGSGTTLLAARMLGIRSIGIEIEERYCASIAKRLQQQAFSFEAPASCDTTDKGIPSYQESLLLEA